ncbi:O-antigen polymerase [Frankia sp. Cas4]|uniref:O-antigen polymerase n=1 Tax=Frankia sp. Cas4 TaxID=3073927 RepID=UPI002AD2EA4A|nr:O-antigen polymerase [Frankia sp. Cas4]
MSTDGIIALTLAAILCLTTNIVTKRRSGRVNPVFIHNLVWIAALLIFAAGLIQYNHLSLHAWMLLVAGLAGANLPALLPPGPAVAGTNIHSTKPATKPWPGCTLILPALFAIGFVCYLQAISGTYGIGRILSDPAFIRSRQGSDQFVDSFPLYARLLYFLGPFVFFCYANPKISGIRAPRTVRWIVIISVSAALLMSLGRTLPFVALAWHSTAALLTSRQKVDNRTSRKRRLAIPLISVIAALAAFQYIGSQLGKLGSADARYQSYVTSTSLQGSPWTSLIVYATSGIPAFGSLVDDPTSHLEYGRQTASPLLKIVPITTAGKEVSQFVNVPFPTNVYTWFEPYYRDFGDVGVVVFSLLIGFALTHTADRASEGPIQLSAAALLIGLSAWAPFVNKYVSSFTLEYLVILVIIHRSRKQLATDRTTPELAATARLRPA